MASQAVIALGGNVGNVKETFKQTYNLIEKRVGIIKLKSGLYKTKAWGKENQPDFINQVISVDTSLPPQKVLELCLKIEDDLGRVRLAKWGKRIIDIDIIFYEDLILESITLKIPHPLMVQRNFVLYPMAEILPTYIHPVLKKTINELKDESIDNLEVYKME